VVQVVRLGARSAQGLDRLAALVVLDVADDDDGAFLRQPLGAAEADPAGPGSTGRSGGQVRAKPRGEPVPSAVASQARQSGLASQSR